MRIVLLGGPGVGKGTQARKLSKDFNVPHIATGDILRQYIEDGTEMGSMAKSYMDKGLLLPDDVVVGIIEGRLAKPDAKAGFILDGFPRTVPQAQALDDMLDTGCRSNCHRVSSIEHRASRKLDAVLNINIKAEIVVQRLSGRRTCRNCQAVYHIVHSPPKKAGICNRCDSQLYQREDDKEETITKRLQVYEKQTSPLLDYYRRSGKLVEVPGDGTIEEVYIEIRRSLQVGTFN